ncbi:MAG: hypothetical protein IPK00_21045 [Deltaproteobacteria bacterium]|nr:hypothetical protein [Deltaproteobacteria bacterium]
MAKTERVDCVEVKRKAQRGLLEALAGRSPADQVEILRRLAEESPFWKKVSRSERKRPAQSTARATQRKKTA